MSQIITVNGKTVTISDYYQIVDSMPDDPADSDAGLFPRGKEEVGSVDARGELNDGKYQVHIWSFIGEST